ncbi:MAG: hypothetical protein ACXW5U_15650 [Thermoanaerobaculia bacterium]
MIDPCPVDAALKDRADQQRSRLKMYMTIGRCRASIIRIASSIGIFFSIVNPRLPDRLRARRGAVVDGESRADAGG